MSSMHPAVTKDITNQIMAQARILFAGSPAASSRGGNLTLVGTTYPK